VVAKQRATASQPWVLTWSDEFTGAAGTKPDPTRWVADVGGHGWGNQQLEYDTADTRNVSVDGRGRLAITASTVTGGRTCWYGACRYTSGRITTKARFSQRYGRLEAAMMIPCGAGLWPAFWALGTDIDTVGWPGSGEIDVMENIGTQPYTVHGTVHGPGYSGGDAISGTTTTPARLCDGFHVYSATWTPASITFSVDGRAYATATPSQTRGNPWVFGHPFFLLLDLAVGGGWPGSPTSATAFPATLLVDWVRVYRAA
jgi:beta-glucanase (GH16 family)